MGSIKTLTIIFITVGDSNTKYCVKDLEIILGQKNLNGSSQSDKGFIKYASFFKCNLKSVNVDYTVNRNGNK